MEERIMEEIENETIKEQKLMQKTDELDQEWNKITCAELRINKRKDNY